MARTVVAVLAAIRFACLLHGHLCEYSARQLAGGAGVLCWLRNRRIHHPAWVHRRARAVF